MNLPRRACPTFLLAFAPLAAAQTGFVNWETPHVHPLTLTPSGARLLAVNTADNRLEVFTVGPAGVTRAMSIPVGLDPVSVRARSETEAWVVNHVSDSISVVDLVTGRVVRTILTADEPADVVFAGAPARAFVSISQRNQIAVYDPATPGAAPVVLAVEGEDPRALAVSPDGTRVYAAIFESGNTTTVVRQQDVSNPNGPYAGRNPPPNAGNTFSPALAPGLPAAPPVAQIVRRDAAGVWRDDNGRDWSAFVTWNLHDHDVAIIDAASLGVTYASGLMSNVMALGVRPDGVLSAVGTEAVNEMRFEPNVTGVFIRCRVASFAPGTPAAAQIADLNPHLTYQSSSIPPAQRALSLGDPRGIAWHPTLTRAYVAGMGSNSVIVTDASGARFAQIGVGEGPTGLAISADGARVYVLNKFEASVSVIDTAVNAELGRTAFHDPTPDAIRDGRPFLYDTRLGSGLGQAACASCHIDGRTDFLAWDLGDPSGAVKAFNQDCRQPVCRPWHPLKGPMVTQSFQGIIGTEPFHWRGDREDLAAFSPAFVSLQGADAEPTSTQMAALTAFVATINYPPSPNRVLNGGMPASIAVTGGTGNPNAGLNLYNTLAVLPGNTRCVSCHALPTGTNGQIDDPNLPLAPQSLKMAQLRGLWEKVGWSRASQNNAKGFGFNHHSEFDTINAVLMAGFNFGTPPQSVQRRRDVEAFMLCFDTGTHAGVGQQVTLGPPDGAATARLNAFIGIADTGAVGLVAKGFVGGIARGWQYLGSGLFQSDRDAETISEAALRASAAAGGEITYTLVTAGTQRRIGVDRDTDGWLDRDELDAGSDPADGGSIPCDPDYNADGNTDQDDVATLIDDVAGGAGSGSRDPDFNRDGNVDQDDVAALINRVAGGPCP